MIITGLVLSNFRNYRELALEGFSPGVNLLAGENAQGKTNLLEAINYLSCAKSFRAAQESGMILHGVRAAYLRADYQNASTRGKIEAALFGDRRRSVKVNGLPAKTVGDMLGHINTVVFTPEDLRTVKEGPSLRRRMLDVELCKVRPAYYGDLQAYTRLLREKNALLKAARPDGALLSVFNEQLAGAGAKIIERRAAYLARLGAFAQQMHAGLAAGESLELRYKCCADVQNPLTSLQKKLEDVCARECEMHTALVGVHREDIEIVINGRDARLYASQGQQRTAMLSVKLACAALVRDYTGEYPVLLLDDVFSELDQRRKERLLQKTKKTQVFITSADISEIDKLTEANFYEVSEGRVFLRQKRKKCF